MRTTALLLLVVVVLCVPTGCVLRRARRQAQRTTCRANLSMIGRCAMLYRAEHGDEAWPATLAELAKAQPLSAKALRCPEAQGLGRTCDYFYLPHAKIDAAGPALIACDLKGNHSDGSRNCLLNDGAVMGFTEEAFQVELKKPQNAAFAKALAAAE